MRFLYEDKGIYHVECDECQRELKFKPHQLEVNFSQVKLVEPVECFCGCIDDEISNMPTNTTKTLRQQIGQIRLNNIAGLPSETSQQKSENVPHCPTCGSINVEKITFTRKAVGFAAIGILSKSVRSTFKCKQCGYRW